MWKLWAAKVEILVQSNSERRLASSDWRDFVIFGLRCWSIWRIDRFVCRCSTWFFTIDEEIARLIAVGSSVRVVDCLLRHFSFLQCLCRITVHISDLLLLFSSFLPLSSSCPQSSAFLILFYSFIWQPTCSSPGQDRRWTASFWNFEQNSLS